MTTEEAIRALFPKRVVDRVDREVEERDRQVEKTTENTEKSRRSGPTNDKGS